MITIKLSNLKFYVMSHKIENKASATKNTIWIANFIFKKSTIHCTFNKIIIIKLSLI